MDLRELLGRMVREDASDLYLKAGSVPVLRIDGELVPVGGETLREEDTDQLARQFMTERQRARFAEALEMDLAYHERDIGRFRVNMFREREDVALVLRSVKMGVGSFEELGLPVETMRSVCSQQRGLILVTGTAGSGKSTTLAAMVDYVNATRRAHIVTVEDPIEFLHEDKKGIVNQREVGIDTHSFADALRHVIRQSPDCILIGEMRDLETISAGVAAADIGHLVFSTLHAIDPPQTMERIVNYFPPYQHDEVRMQLAYILRAIISMRLLPRASGKGRVPAVAMLVSTPAVQKMIREGRIGDLDGAMRSGAMFGMRTFN